MSEKASTSSSAPSGKQKERDNTVKFSLALNSTQYIPAAEPPSPSSPTNFVSESVHSGRGSISSPHPRRHTQKHLRSIVSNIEDDNSINDNVRQLVSNDRVLYEASALSSSITEYKALKIAFNSLSSTIRLNLGSIGDGTVSKDLVNLHPGLDKYDMRALYFMLSLSCVIFLTLTIFWHSQISAVSALVTACIPIVIYCIIVLPNVVIEESVIIIQNLGFKVKKKYFFGQEAVKFVELDRLENVFIHEYIFRSEVKFSLAIIVEGEDNLLLVFHDIYPGFQALRSVYRACYRAL